MHGAESLPAGPATGPGLATAAEVAATLRPDADAEGLALAIALRLHPSPSSASARQTDRRSPQPTAPRPGLCAAVNHKKRAARASHPERNRQFEYIAAKRRGFQRRHLPVVSIDTKKKELVGYFKNPGAVWARAPTALGDAGADDLDAAADAASPDASPPVPDASPPVPDASPPVPDASPPVPDAPAPGS